MAVPAAASRGHRVNFEWWRLPVEVHLRLADQQRHIASTLQSAMAAGERIFEVPVHLFLFVKVREKWGDDPERYREMGLEFPR